MMVLQENLRPKRLCTISSGLHFTTPAFVRIVMLPPSTVIMPVATPSGARETSASAAAAAAAAAREPLSAGFLLPEDGVARGLDGGDARGLAVGLSVCSSLDLSPAMSSDHFNLCVLGGVGRRSMGVSAVALRNVFLNKSCSPSKAPDPPTSQSMLRGTSDLEASLSSKAESCCRKFGFICISSCLDSRNAVAFFRLHLYFFIM
mmetsp:Transcript_140723/g.437705  ORF Transcript_140723/g.437705 Transcript_140723/m.437705 type:complete len:204 (+) Transcript_140723:374-985(+)